MADNAQLLQQMRDTVEGFRSHSVSLSDVVERLPQLLAQTEGIDEEWREEYISCWWTLEQIHSEAIDLGESRRMPEGSRDTVDDAIDGLARLLSQMLVKHESA